jgi:hypothetical protein
MPFDLIVEVSDFNGANKKPEPGGKNVDQVPAFY